jgi:tRNA threonylcarbamoyladenosine biosynthesis protein TsaB
LKILGIDTTTDILNLTIIENKVLIFDYMINKPGITHSSILIPSLRNIMKISEINLNELDGIAVSVGPGSFTGLRVGLATAKGLAFSLSIPIIGVNSLEAYALKWKELPGILCPIIQARKDEYYFTFYKKERNNENLVRIEEYQCLNWTKISQIFAKYKEQIFVVGQGLLGILRDDKNKYYHNDNIKFIVREQDPPGAKYVALIGDKKISKNVQDNIYEMSPFYINKSGAEIKKEKQRITAERYKSK